MQRIPVIQRRGVSLWTSPVLLWGKQRIQKPPVPLPPFIETLNPHQITPEHYFDISESSLSGQYREIKPQQRTHPQPMQFGNQLMTKDTRFPPDTRGFLYFFSPPDQHPYAGGIRFRCAKEATRAAFLAGKDLYTDYGLPWHLPLWEIATMRDYEELAKVISREGYLPQDLLNACKALKVTRGSNFLTAIGMPFVTDLAFRHTRLYICQPHTARFPLPLMIEHPWFNRKLSGHSPVSGKAVLSIRKNDDNSLSLSIDKVVRMGIRSHDPRHVLPETGQITPLKIRPIVSSTKIKEKKLLQLIPSCETTILGLPLAPDIYDILQVYQSPLPRPRNIETTPRS